MEGTVSLVTLRSTLFIYQRVVLDKILRQVLGKKSVGGYSVENEKNKINKNWGL